MVYKSIEHHQNLFGHYTDRDKLQSFYWFFIGYLRYDLKDTSKINLVDIIFLAAMGPPGGARNPVTTRFLRHFNIVSTLEFNDETMTKIFSSIMSFHLKAHEFPTDIFATCTQIVTATMEVSICKYCLFVLFTALAVQPLGLGIFTCHY